MGSNINIGWGKADITPKGAPISLHGQYDIRITEEIRDPLYANTVVMQSGDTRVIWVACDLCFTSLTLTDEVKRLLKISLPDYKEEQLILSATHIHTGPALDPGVGLSSLDDRKDPPGTVPTVECCRQIALGIEKSVLQAVAGIEPSSIEFAVSYTITGVSRRVSFKDGSGAMYGDINRPDFAGMEGRDGGLMQMLYVRRESDNALTGIIAAVPCTAQADEVANYVTADYWATARKTVEARFGAGVTLVGLPRSAGDLSPHAMADRGKFINYVTDDKAAAEMGKRVGDAIIRAADDIIVKYGPETVFKLAHAYENIPLWVPTESEYDEAKKYLAGGAIGNMGAIDHPFSSRSEALSRVKRYEYGASEYPADFFAVRIGDVAFITTPFELYIEYADRIRAACPEAQVIDVQLTGREHLAYLPTKKAFEAGGYSAWLFCCYYNAEGGEAVVEKCVKLVKSLF